MTVALVPSKGAALFHHFFVAQKRSLEGAPGPEVSTTFLPDTTPKSGQQQFMHGYYVSGPWGKAKFGGTNWPDRWLIEDV